MKCDTIPIALIIHRNGFQSVRTKQDEQTSMMRIQTILKRPWPSIMAIR